MERFGAEQPESLREAALRECRDLPRAQGATGWCGAATQVKRGLVGWRLGDFWIQRQLCQGETGVVYLAHQVSMGRRAAVKVLPVRLTLSHRYVHRFRREGDKLAQLRHPGVVRVLAFGHDSGMSYLAMEFVDGHSLRDEIAGLREPQRGRHPRPFLPPRSDPAYFRRVAELMAAVAEAVQEAHLHDVVHRDLEPRNVIIDPAGRPRVIGFGLTKDMAYPLSRPEPTVDGSSYLSPEQAMEQRDAIDRRSDVFSLGAVLYELLTLRRPFRGETGVEVRRAIATLEPTPPVERVAGVPPELDAICLRALVKRPAGRFADAGAMAAELRRFLRAEPVTCRRRSRIDGAALWLHAHRLAAAAGMLALAGALLVLLLAGRIG